MTYLPAFDFKTVKVVKRLSNGADLVTCDGLPGIRYWHTIVAAQKPNGGLAIRSGGYFTKTTKKWINKAIELWLDGAFYLFQKNYDWYIEDRKSGKVTPFVDGMTLYSAKEG